MAFQRAPRALPTSPRDSPGVSLSTTDRVSCEKIMYEERGLLGAFGSFLAFLVFLPAAPAASLPFFAAGAFLTFFLGRCSASLSLPPPSLSLPDSALAFFAFVPAAAFLAAAGAFFFFAPLLAPLSLPPPSLSPSLPSLSDASEGSPPSSSSLPPLPPPPPPLASALLSAAAAAAPPPPRWGIQRIPGRRSSAPRGPRWWLRGRSPPATYALPPPTPVPALRVCCQTPRDTAATSAAS
mmetsp:Transcript_30653/g.76775  ORF Transcript_30653/g.76775 Transcript_30653/m.76775 type:complete len:238 (-) Transcript_30653:1262-1975(-)